MFLIWKNFCNLLRRLRKLEARAAADSTITYVSSNYLVQDTDSTIVADSSGGSITLTLPPAATIEGKRLTFKRIPSGGNNVVIQTQGGEMIDDSSDYTLVNDWQTVTLRATATMFIITASAGA